MVYWMCLSRGMRCTRWWAACCLRSCDDDHFIHQHTSKPAGLIVSTHAHITMISGSSGPPWTGEYGVSCFDALRVLICKVLTCFYGYRYIHTHWPTGVNMCVYTHGAATETTLFNFIWRGEYIQIISTCISAGFTSSVLQDHPCQHRHVLAYKWRLTGWY
jgi:hypothetical protein